jgi:hypothetical protein
MDYFKQLQSEQLSNLTNTRKEALLKLISFRAISCGDYSIYTYRVKTKKRQPDDTIYSDNLELIDLVPRAFSILTQSSTIIGVIQGNTKFSGKTPLDEDPDDINSTKMDTSLLIYNHSEIIDWAKLGILEITRTSKLNGKNAVLTICRDLEDQLVLFGGSKNSHRAIRLEYVSDKQILEKILSDLDVFPKLTADIFRSISYQIDLIISSSKIMDFFLKKGGTLVGEYCDGEHFTKGDNQVHWFSMTIGGNSQNPIQSLTLFNSIKLPSTDFEKVFTKESNISNLENIYLLSRCGMEEGDVLYLRNTQTGKITLVKTKSTRYITFRFMRQCLLRGYKSIEDVMKRFIDASDYHGLNTTTAVIATHKLMKFGMWMMKKQLPVKILGHMPVHSVRGTLPHGFYNYWSQYILEEGSHNDLIFHPEDFEGEFNSDNYLCSCLDSLYEIRNKTVRPIVVMIQGLQGSGKSTLGKYISNFINNYGIKTCYVEQDEYFGDTNATQGALYHMIRDSNGPEVIILTRCNVNPKQYQKYLNMFHVENCRVLFFTPEKIDTQYVAICLSGLLKRSKNGDEVMIGRFESPIEEVYQWVIKNYNDFKVPQYSHRYPVFRETPTTQLSQQYLLQNDPKKDIKFIRQYLRELDQARYSLTTVCSSIIKKIMETHSGSLENLFPRQKYKFGKSNTPTYIGLFLNSRDREILDKKLFKCVTPSQYESRKYLEHVTQFFIGNSNKIPKGSLKPFQKCYGEVDYLAIRNSDGCCAYHISYIYTITDGIRKQVLTKERPHITALVPNNLSPKISNDYVEVTSSEIVTRIPYKIILELTCLWI